MRKFIASVLLLGLSGLWHRCWGHTRCEEPALAVQSVHYEEPPHVDPEDTQPAALMQMSEAGAGSSTAAPFVPDDDGQVFNLLLARTWPPEPFVAPIMVPDELPVVSAQD